MAKLRADMEARTVEATLQLWVAARLRSGEATPATIEDQTARVRNLLGSVMDWRLDELTERKAAALYERATTEPSLKTGRPLSAASHRFYLSIVQCMWKWALKQGYAKENPWAEVEPIGRVSAGKPQLRPAEARRFAQLAQLAEQEAGAGSGPALAALCCLSLGLRASEALGPTARDIDVEASEVYVSGTKTAAARRRLKVPGYLAALLGRAAAARHSTDRLCVATRQTLHSTVVALCARAGVPRVCVHGLRGTHASLAVSGGASVEAVARVLGHTSTKMTLGHYVTEEAATAARVAAVDASLSLPNHSEAPMAPKLTDGEIEMSLLLSLSPQALTMAIGPTSLSSALGWREACRRRARRYSVSLPHWAGLVITAELTSLLALTPEGLHAELERVQPRTSAQPAHALSFKLDPLQKQAALLAVGSVGCRLQRLPSEVAQLGGQPAKRVPPREEQLMAHRLLARQDDMTDKGELVAAWQRATGTHLDLKPDALRPPAMPPQRPGQPAHRMLGKLIAERRVCGADGRHIVCRCPCQINVQQQQIAAARAGRQVGKEPRLVVQVAERVADHRPAASSIIGAMGQRDGAAQVEEVPMDRKHRHSGQRRGYPLPSFDQQRVADIQQVGPQVAPLCQSLREPRFAAAVAHAQRDQVQASIGVPFERHARDFLGGERVTEPLDIGGLIRVIVPVSGRARVQVGVGLFQRAARAVQDALHISAHVERVVLRGHPLRRLRMLGELLIEPQRGDLGQALAGVAGRLGAALFQVGDRRPGDASAPCKLSLTQLGGNATAAQQGTKVLFWAHMDALAHRPDTLNPAEQVAGEA